MTLRYSIVAALPLLFTGAAFNGSFPSGFAVEHSYKVRNSSFSGISALDTSLLRDDTRITAVAAAADRFVIGTSNRGVFESFDSGKSWSHADADKIPMLTDTGNQRQVYAFDDGARLLTHKHDILVRTGKTWQPVKSDMGRSVIFTAIHRGKNTLYLGTSVNGLKAAPLTQNNYQSLLNGEEFKLKFKTINAGMPGRPHSKSHFMYEEVQAIDELADGDVLVATGPSPAIYLKPRDSGRFQKVAVAKLSDALDECKSVSAVARNKVVLSCSRGVWSGSLDNPDWNFTAQVAIVPDAAAYGGYALTDADGNRLSFVGFKSRLTNEKRQRMQNAAGQRVMYASAYTWSKRQGQVLAELKSGFWTGLVIDGKDDNGIIRFDSDVPLARSIGAVRPLYKMADVAAKVHALGKRLIVRLVIFKDPKLFEREGYAILDAAGGKWKGTEKERWIDPYNPNLLSEYYAPMMRELTDRGVDEIQLDYIRFPSDGPVGRCRFSHKKALWQEVIRAATPAIAKQSLWSGSPPDYYYSEALENFLTGVRQATPLAIGADIYGYNGMYRVPGSIGQDLEVYGRVLDVISPMHYSSHFGDDYMRHLPRDERAYNLLLLALSRGTFFAKGEFVMRPYIQAFSMKDGLWGYGKKYFADQIKGVADGGGSGFLFWGKLDDMTLVRKTQVGP